MNGITAALTGRLGSDAELKYLPSGGALATFSVAVDDAKKAEGDPAEWLRATVWGEQAEDLAPRLVKGTRVYLEGRLKLEQWQARDGAQRATLKLSAWACQPMGQIGKQRPRQGGQGVGAYRHQTPGQGSRRREEDRPGRMPAMAAAVGNGRRLLDDDDWRDE